MKKFKFKIKSADYNVEIINVKKNMINIEVNGSSFEVELQSDVAPPKTPILVRAEPKIEDSERTIIKTKTKTKNTQVKSPLPGTIVQVLVKDGDKISLGQKLLTMEAMKMENNIQSEIEGVVKKVHVKSGDTVLQNELLVEIE